MKSALDKRRSQMLHHQEVVCIYHRINSKLGSFRKQHPQNTCIKRKNAHKVSKTCKTGAEWHFLPCKERATCVGKLANGNFRCPYQYRSWVSAFCMPLLVAGRLCHQRMPEDCAKPRAPREVRPMWQPGTSQIRMTRPATYAFTRTPKLTGTLKMPECRRSSLEPCHFQGSRYFWVSGYSLNP